MVKGEVGGQIRTLHINMLLSYCFVRGDTCREFRKEKRGTKSYGSTKNVAYQFSSSSSSHSEEERIAISRRTRSTVSKGNFVQNNSTEDFVQLSLYDDYPVKVDSHEINQGRPLEENPYKKMKRCYQSILYLKLPCILQDTNKTQIRVKKLRYLDTEDLPDTKSHQIAMANGYDVNPEHFCDW
jgi:hypothetical protein